MTNLRELPSKYSFRSNSATSSLFSHRVITGEGDTAYAATCLGISDQDVWSPGGVNAGSSNLSRGTTNRINCLRSAGRSVSPPLARADVFSQRVITSRAFGLSAIPLHEYPEQGEQFHVCEVQVLQRPRRHLHHTCAPTTVSKGRPRRRRGAQRAIPVPSSAVDRKGVRIER